jgi:hypothetical protein
MCKLQPENEYINKDGKCSEQYVTGMYIYICSKLFKGFYFTSQECDLSIEWKCVNEMIMYKLYVVGHVIYSLI